MQIINIIFPTKEYIISSLVCVLSCHCNLLGLSNDFFSVFGDLTRLAYLKYPDDLILKNCMIVMHINIHCYRSFILEPLQTHFNMTNLI